jgi:hypothetical protein
MASNLSEFKKRQFTEQCVETVMTPENKTKMDALNDTP